MSGLARAVGRLEERVSSLERDMATLKHWAMRFAILLGLWATAIVGNLNAEQLAQIVVAALKSS
jgi:hypothetical protein